jgi:hypothetical protein
MWRQPPRSRSTTPDDRLRTSGYETILRNAGLLYHSTQGSRASFRTCIESNKDEEEVAKRSPVVTASSGRDALWPFHYKQRALSLLSLSPGHWILELLEPDISHNLAWTAVGCVVGVLLSISISLLQGYLAHKKTPTP